MIDRDEFAAWFRLLETPGSGRDSARALLTHFGSPEAALSASIHARQAVVPAAAATALAGVPAEVQARLDAALAWLAGADAEPRDAIVIGDPRYPPLLLEAPDAPLLLYMQGRAELLAAPSIAIVGSRNPTAQGIENARAFAEHLSRAGFTIVSGMALGIDGAAHDGALGGAGKTIAVVGTGLDRVYPARHRALARRIAKDGLIVSEFAIGTPALPQHFPIRNRIIAGLARGTLVVEAAVQSGSLITARLAVESGRDVFAIPGSIHSPQSRGCHVLIKQGAKLVDSAADIVDELPLAGAATAGATAPRRPVAQPSAAASADAWLLDALGYDPIDLDALIARTGRGAAELSARLLELELAGRVARLAGQRYQRVDRA